MFRHKGDYTMKKKHRLFCIALLLCGLASAWPRDAFYNGDDYTIALSYTDTVKPGEAVFVRLRFESTDRSAAQADALTSALLILPSIGQCEFYAVPVRAAGNQHVKEFLAAVPLSTYQESGSIELQIVYNAFGGKTMEFSLPVQIDAKEFISEVIPLDSRNTGIRTDNSPERIAQINKLNTILETINPDAVYQTEPFTPPTDAVRRTSFFGDRRTYAYSDGTSAESLHFGIDYGIPTGSPVAACGAGKVVLAENRISTGWSVVIEHLPGLYSLYYHMDSLLVREGQIVRQGEQLGVSGATGLATGPHLHWEVRLNMEAVDPDFFTADFSFSSKHN